MQRAGHKLVVREDLVPVVDQPGRGGIKLIDTVDARKLKRRRRNAQGMLEALAIVLHTGVEQILRPNEEGALLALELIFDSHGIP